MKMFFDGAHDAYEEAVAGGEASGEAFFNRAIVPSLPVVVALGVGLSLLAASDLFWPLIVLRGPETWTGSMTVMQMRAVEFTGVMSIGTAVLYAGVFALIFLPVIAILQGIVLDRLALIAGSPKAAPGMTEEGLPIIDDSPPNSEDQNEDAEADSSSEDASDTGDASASAED